MESIGQIVPWIVGAVGVVLVLLLFGRIYAADAREIRRRQQQRRDGAPNQNDNPDWIPTRTGI